MTSEWNLVKLSYASILAATVKSQPKRACFEVFAASLRVNFGATKRLSLPAVRHLLHPGAPSQSALKLT